MSKLAVHLIRNTVDVATSKTLTAADQGIVQNVIVDNITITLPATSVGFAYTIRNGGAKISAAAAAGTGSDGTVGITLVPQTADAVAGLNFVATAGKGAVDVKATSKVGDEITVVASGTAGAVAWNVREAFGIWTRQA